MGRTVKQRSWMPAALWGLCLWFGHGAVPLLAMAEDAEEATEPPASRERRLGPFIVESDSGDQLQIGFAVQFRGELTDPDIQTRGRDADDRFWLRRQRFRLDASLLGGRLLAGVQLNLAPAALELMDVWLAGVVRPQWVWRVGQFKLPFTQYRDLSFRRLSLVDWSLGPDYFGSERQLGTSIAYVPLDGGLHFDFGVYAGESARASYSVATMYGYGEQPPNPSDLRNPGPFTDLHGELALRVMHSAPGMPLDSLRDETGEGLRHLVAFSIAWDADPHPFRDLVARAAGELGLAFRRVALRAIAYGALAHSRRGRALTGPWGGFVEANLVIHPMFDLAARYARVELPAALRRDQRAHGRERVEVADDVAAAMAQYAAAGTLRSQQEVTLGGNVFIVGHQLELQVDVGARAAETDETVWSLVLRTQLQIAF